MRIVTIFPVIAIALGVMFLLYTIIPHGVGISEDSISYLSAANSLNGSGTMYDIDGSYFVAWAPLYPLLVTALKILPFKIEHSLAALNLLLFILTAISSWSLITQVMEKQFFRFACLLSIVFSFTIIQVYAVALTEALFLLMINLVLLWGTRKDGRWTMDDGRWKIEGLGARDYIVPGIMCAVALLLRYAGIFLLPVVLGFLFWKNERKIARRKVLVFLAIAILPLAFWVGRNWMLTGTLTGFRSSGGIFFLKNVTVLAETITSWILPIKIPLPVRLGVLGILVLLLRKTFLQKNNRVHLLLITCYLLFLVVAYLFFSFEEPRDRLPAPMFISFSILLFSGLERFSHRSQLTIPLVTGAVCLWMFYPASRIIKHVQLWHREGVEVYNKKYWDDSQTIVWLRENKVAQEIFSNDAHAIYYFAGENAFRVPKSFYHFDRFNESAHDGDYLVWWKGREYYNLKLIEAKYNLKEEERFDDAVIYLIKPKP